MLEFSLQHEKLLNRAFQLAWFLHSDRELALQIAMGAYEKLEVAATAQDKRLYYQAGKRAEMFGSNRSRNKVNLNELHLLQRLTMLESDPHEQKKEFSIKQSPAPPALTKLDTIMTMHYLKQLAQVTLNRNAFYATLGIARLLYNFSTSETMEIYDAVTQDEGMGPDDYYYRSRKGLLMDELQDRFGEMLKIRRGLRGEERFEAQPDSSKFLDLVKNCLHHFAPWDVPVAVPEDYNARQHRLPQLSGDNSQDGYADDHWHKVEVARMHTVINPECFDRLVTGLGLAKPVTRLELPRFFWSQATSGNDPDEPTYHDQDSDRGGDDNDDPPQLNSGDVQSILSELAARAGRRRFTAARLLRVLVNGNEQARLDLTQATQTQISIKPNTQLIEVRGQDEQGEILLAVFAPRMGNDDKFAPQTAAITIEGGQRLQFTLTPSENNDLANVLIQSRQTSWTSSFALWCQQQFVQAEQFTAELFGASPLPKLALTLLFVLLSGTIIYWLLNRSTTQIAIHQGEATPSPSVVASLSPTITPTLAPRISPTPTMAVSPKPKPSPTTTPQRLSNDVIAMDIRVRGNDILTRSELSNAIGLLEAKKLYLEINGSESLRNQIGTQLKQRLQTDNQFIFTADPDEADIALKATVAMAADSQLQLTVGLADEYGKVIWPLTANTSGRKYKGAIEKVIIKLSQDLASDLQKLPR